MWLHMPTLAIRHQTVYVSLSHVMDISLLGAAAIRHHGIKPPSRITSVTTSTRGLSRARTYASSHTSLITITSQNHHIHLKTIKKTVAHFKMRQFFFLKSIMPTKLISEGMSIDVFHSRNMYSEIIRNPTNSKLNIENYEKMSYTNYTEALYYDKIRIYL